MKNLQNVAFNQHLKVLFTLLILIGCVDVQAQFSPVWNETFNGSGSETQDRVVELLEDASGNIYALYEADADGVFNASDLNKIIYLVKYNSSGTQLASATLDFDSFRNAVGMGMDASNNIYVVINSGSVQVNHKCRIIKYNTSLSVQWNLTIGGAAGNTITAMTVDNSGNTYVVGSIPQTATQENFYVTKYNSSGTFQWSDTYNNAGNADRALDIVLDGSGNAFVTGYYENDSGYLGAVTIKYNSSGSVFSGWPKTYAYSSTYNHSTNIVRYNNGYTYVAGTFDGAQQLLLVYNSAGTVVSPSISGNTSATDYEPLDMQFDPSGNMILLFKEIDDGTIHISKYGATGSLTWTQEIGVANDVEVSMAIETDDRIIINYYTFSGYGFQTGWWLNAYDGDGNRWEEGNVQLTGTASVQGQDKRGIPILKSFSGRLIYAYLDETSGVEDFTIESYTSGPRAYFDDTFILGCKDEAESLSINTDTGLTFSWSPSTGLSSTNSATTTATYDAPVSYTVAVTDQYGNTTTSSEVTVSRITYGQGTAVAQDSDGNFHVPSTGNNLPMCNGETITLIISSANTSIYTSAWFSDNPNFPDGIFVNQSIDVTEPGTYWFEKHHTNTGCDDPDGLISQSFTIVDGDVAPNAPSSISGEQTPCEGDQIAYSVSHLSTHHSYQWSFPNDWSQANLNSFGNIITLNVGSDPGDVEVVVSNRCGTEAAPVTLSVTPFASSGPVAPGTISTSGISCLDGSNTFSVTAVAGLTYNWDYPVGWTLQNDLDNSITLSFPDGSPTSGTVSVAAVDGCGTEGASSSLPVTILGITPPSEPTILDPGSICVGDQVTFQIENPSGSLTYNWTLPSGWTGETQGSSITVDAQNSSTSLKLTASDGCITSSELDFTLNVRDTPNLPSVIIGTSIPNVGDVVVYSVTNDPEVDTYHWTLPSDWSGTSTTNEITVTVGYVKDNISVYAENNCGTSSTRSKLVGKTQQFIETGDSYTFEYGDNNFLLPFTTSAGPAYNINYQSNDENVVSMSGVSITVVGVGTTTIDASHAGDVTYHSVDKEIAITVNKRTQIITVDPIDDKLNTDSPFNVNPDINSNNDIVFEVSGPANLTTNAFPNSRTVNLTGALGLVTITMSEPGDANHESVTESISFNVVLDSFQDITFSPLSSKVFGDPDFDLSATASSGLPVSYVSSNTNVATISGSTVTIIGAGTSTITASQTGNANYDPAADVQQTLTVNKAEQSITFEPVVSKTFGDPDFDLTATSSSGLEITYESSDASVASVTGNTVMIVGAGSTTITASQAGNNNYLAASDVPQSLEIDKADQTINFGPLADLTAGESIVLSASATSGLIVSYIISGPATLVGNELTADATGLVTVTAKQSGNGNYNAASDVLQSFDIVESKADQTISFGALETRAFGDESFDLTATASSGLAVSFSSSDLSVATISGNIVTIVGAGSTTISASQSGDDDYLAAENVDQVLTVEKAEQTLSFNLGENATKVFGDDPFSLAATASSGLAVVFSSSDPSVASIDNGNVEINGAGTTTITAIQSGNENFNTATNVDQILTVDKAEQIITFSPESIGDQNLSNGSVTFDITVNTGAELTVGVKSGPATVANIGPDFYEVTFTGEGEIVVEASVTVSTNYTAAYAELSFAVIDDTKSVQTISFGSLETKTFGDDPFVLSATTDSGLEISYSSSNESVATISGNTVTIIGAGSTTITASQAGNEQYLAAQDVDQTLTVEKADQLISFDELINANVGDEITLSATTTSGLEIAYDVTGPATLTGNILTPSGEGTVTVVASQGGDANYNAAPDVSRSFEVISLQPQTITFNAILPKTFGDAPFNLTATASSGLPISYVSSDASVATISGFEVSIVGAGTTVITASQGGNDDYEAATDVSQILTINKANQVITIASIEDKFTSDNPFEVDAEVDSELPLTYTVSGPATIADQTITLDGLAGTVNVTVSQDGNENYAAAQEIESFEVLEVVLGTEEIISVRMYPNPVTDFVTIQSEKDVDVRIFDLKGNLVLFKQGVQKEINLGSLNTGMYLIELSLDGQASTTRFYKN